VARFQSSDCRFNKPASQRHRNLARGCQKENLVFTPGNGHLAITFRSCSPYLFPFAVPRTVMKNHVTYCIKEEEKKESCSSLSKLDFFLREKAQSFWRIIIHNRCYLLRCSIHAEYPRSPGFWWFWLLRRLKVWLLHGLNSCQDVDVSWNRRDGSEIWHTSSEKQLARLDVLLFRPRQPNSIASADRAREAYK